MKFKTLFSPEVRQDQTSLKPLATHLFCLFLKSSNNQRMYVKYKCLSDRFLEGVSVHLHLGCQVPHYLYSI